MTCGDVCDTCFIWDNLSEYIHLVIKQLLTYSNNVINELDQSW